jgi:hypothetical protein
LGASRRQFDSTSAYSKVLVLTDGEPRLFSYVVARDYGFAPNPFHGVCTLATCKPKIRKAAAIGDWVIGTGSASKNRTGFLVYGMKVEEALTFEQYWSDSRYFLKRPNLQGSKKQAFGDNIYSRQGGRWHQIDSHHSFSDGSPNPKNIAADTCVNRVLISRTFTYWGGEGPAIPARFRNFDGQDICALRNHRGIFLEKMLAEFLVWLEPHAHEGYLGEPLDWARTP